MLAYEKRDIFTYLDFAVTGFLQQNCDPHFQTGRFDRNRQAAGEARSQSRFYSVYFLGESVARNDNLLVCVDQRVKGVEKLLLGAGFVRNELNIVNQQQIQ